MDKAKHLVAAAVLAASAGLAHAQGFTADYDLSRHWFGQVGLSQAPLNALTPGSNDVLNVGGGYRFNDGQSLSLQVSRARGPLPRLGLAVSYDWPRYFVRFTYDQGLTLTPTENLRFSAGFRF
ncbi:hypothetical protein [Ramlibacter sp. PS4R-6]|uniref:hypothetical protein n=1 Tax=Ramlibacter sp. PS4R-6 TaxID=3133438 RepID=UPI0030A4B67A